MSHHRIDGFGMNLFPSRFAKSAVADGRKTAGEWCVDVGLAVRPRMMRIVGLNICNLKSKLVRNGR